MVNILAQSTSTLMLSENADSVLPIFDYLLNGNFDAHPSGIPEASFDELVDEGFLAALPNTQLGEGSFHYQVTDAGLKFVAKELRLKQFFD